MAYVIGNPRAGRGTVARDWDRLLADFGRDGRDASGSLTREPGHATELARQARRDGNDLVVAVGGDGTVHEVVNGLLADGTGVDVPTLCVVAAGSGCDYLRTFDAPGAERASSGRAGSDSPSRLVDIGGVTCQGRDGPHTRYFVNIAEVGIGAAVARRAARLPRALGRGVYLVSFCLTLPGYRRRQGRVVMGAATHDGAVTNVVVAIGRYFGGGMLVAPRADPGDGLFDVQVQFGSRLDYGLAVPKVFRGTHVPHPRVREERAASVEVLCDPPAPVEADGEVLGTTPATFRVLPGALSLKV